jgi:membrane protein implicated in regulation of membrane protease activity
MNFFLFIDPSFSGLTWVAAISLFTILVDVFFDTKILTVMALLAVSIYFSLLFDISLKWRISILILCWLGTTASYYLIADRFLVPSVKALFTKGLNEASASGEEGVYRIIEGKRFIYWNGDLWHVSDHDKDDFSEGQTVYITSSENGKLTIKHK